MILEISQGIGKPPLRLDASQVLILADNGTPLGVASAYGDGVLFSRASDPDFIKTLVKLGIDRTIILDPLKMPPPPRGAKLLQQL